MSAGDLFTGKRFASVGELISAESDIVGWAFAPDEENGWYVRVPAGSIATLRGHTVTEHDDGTITAAPSILVHATPGFPAWHGYLERGVFREV